MTALEPAQVEQFIHDGFVRLHAAFYQFVGPGRWRPRESLGWFVIRFPVGREPADAGWHVDGSYPTADPHTYGLNLWSRNRALLMLFLFSNVGRVTRRPDCGSAPT